jgi:hypothetical protein
MTELKENTANLGPNTFYPGYRFNKGDCVTESVKVRNILSGYDELPLFILLPLVTGSQFTLHDGKSYRTEAWIRKRDSHYLSAAQVRIY